MNVIRHAQAHNCHVRVTLTDALTIAIEDDGVGLSGPRTAGVGLRSIQERVAELGGECKITSGVEGGTSIVVRLPVAQRQSK